MDLTAFFSLITSQYMGRVGSVNLFSNLCAKLAYKFTVFNWYIYGMVYNHKENKLGLTLLSCLCSKIVFVQVCFLK